MKVCRNSHKLKITLATGSCSKGDLDKDVRQLIAKVLFPMSS